MRQDSTWPGKAYLGRSAGSFAASVGAPALLLMLASIMAPLRAVADTKTGTTSRAARIDAVKAIPLNRLDADARAKASSVINQNCLFRRLPAQTIRCDANLHLFLIRHPEVIVSIWQAMGVTDLKLIRTGPESFRAVDGAGTSGDVEFLYGDDRTHILYIEGQYRGPLYPRPITANCVLVLQSSYAQAPDGSYRVTNQLDTFVDVKNVGVELVAKTFQNVFGRTSDQNFITTSDFVAQLSDAAEKNPAGVERLALRLRDVRPEVRSGFMQTAAGTAHLADARGQEANERPLLRAQSPREQR